MKLSAAILLQIMIVFFTMPLTHNLFGATQQDCSMDKCAEMCPLKAKQKQSDKNACSNGACNPFLNCPFCQYTVIKSLTFSTVAVWFNKVHFIRNEKAVFSYNKECWHPPEMI
jgi:hypothetical protein